jgi:hypothetical protein
MVAIAMQMNRMPLAGRKIEAGARRCGLRGRDVFLTKGKSNANRKE